MKNSQYSQNWSGFESVIHLFPENFAGISAAAGYLPGIKLGVPDDWNDELPVLEGESSLRQDSTVVVHGMSLATYNFLNGLLIRFPDFKIYGVWHGNLTQLAFEGERDLFLLFCELRKFRNFRKSTSVRFEQIELLPKPWNGQILNSPPIKNSGTEKSRNQNALCPSWNDIRKNLAFNLALGVSSEKLKAVHHYQEIFNLDLIINSKKLKKISYKGVENHFQNLSQYEIVLNATVIDCQPMIDLEALAVQSKIISSSHSPIQNIVPHEIYQHIRVDPFDFQNAKLKMDNLLAMDQNTWSDISRDYISKYTKSSRESWERFLEC